MSASMKAREPRRLREGKEFHKGVQEEWERSAEYERLEAEKPVVKPGERAGRIDLFVQADNEGLFAIVEVKNSDWDAMSEQAVRRNVRRQIAQIWDYIESAGREPEGGGEEPSSEGGGICPGVVFRRQPKDPARRALIEELFNEGGIAVAWEDETIEERRERG